MIFLASFWFCLGLLLQLTVCTLQVRGHHPPAEAAHVVHADQGGGGRGLDSGAAAGLPPVLLLHHGAAARPRGLLHRLARVHLVGLQEDVSPPRGRCSHSQTETEEASQRGGGRRGGGEE